MFSNLTQDELEAFIYHETHYTELNPGLQYVFYHYADLLNNTGYIPETPLQVGLNLTDICNINCLHCSRVIAENNNSSEKFMVRWREIIDSLADCEIVQVFLTGGEPTLHPNLDPQTNQQQNKEEVNQTK